MYFFCYLNTGDSPSPPGDLAHPHRRGFVQEQRAQMCGTSSGQQSASESRRPVLWKPADLLQHCQQEEEETQEEAQSRATQGGANHICRRGGGAV